MKKICVFIGSRANYSSCKSIMRSIQNHSALQLQTVLGGSSVLERYGNIESLVINDGFNIDAKFYMIIEGEKPITMAKSTGLGIIELSMIFNNLQPDIVVVVGDRFDVMAPVIAASYMNIPIAHTMGGEVSGTIDESIRHAITKMAHLHFPANEDAFQRIIKMGEKPDMVFNVGCPRIDLIREILEEHRKGEWVGQDFFSKYKGVGEKFNIKSEKFLLVSQHPVTTEYGKNRKHIEQTLHALNEIKMPTIMIWPNADAGTDEVSKGIRTFREQYKPDWLHLFINLPIDVYVKIMDMCACMAGNSSSAIREGSYIGVPVVNIGSRQKGRIRGENVIDVWYSSQEICEAILAQIKFKKYKSDPLYGNGTAGHLIADTLAEIGDINVQKRITF